MDGWMDGRMDDDDDLLQGRRCNGFFAFTARIGGCTVLPQQLSRLSVRLCVSVSVTLVICGHNVGSSASKRIHGRVFRHFHVGIPCNYAVSLASR